MLLLRLMVLRMLLLLQMLLVLLMVLRVLRVRMWGVHGALCDRDRRWVLRVRLLVGVAGPAAHAEDGGRRGGVGVGVVLKYGVARVHIAGRAVQRDLARERDTALRV